MPTPSANAIGQTIGRYGLGGLGGMLAGPLGGFLGRSIGGPLGGAAFSAASMGAKGIGLLLNRLTQGFSGGGNAPSRVGGGAAPGGNGFGSSVSVNPAPLSPHLGSIGHISGISSAVANNMAEVRKRNQL